MSPRLTLTSLGWRKSEVQAQRKLAGTISAVFGSLDALHDAEYDAVTLVGGGAKFVSAVGRRPIDFWRHCWRRLHGFLESKRKNWQSEVASKCLLILESTDRSLRNPNK